MSQLWIALFVLLSMVAVAREYYTHRDYGRH